jgi:peptidyl-prolyl cis-trans isomerase A (cyclophilin A)
MRNFLAITLCMVLSGCSNNNNPQIIIKTTLGNIDAELYVQKAPKTVASILAYIDSGLYKNSSFYRLTLTESMTSADNTGIIQGGIWLSNSAKAIALPGIEHESPAKSGLSHTDGTLSLARTTAGSASSEFFICIGDQTQYDSDTTINNDGLGFAAFGRVTSGMDIVRKIHKQPATVQSFDKPIQILTIERN